MTIYDAIGDFLEESGHPDWAEMVRNVDKWINAEERQPETTDDVYALWSNGLVAVSYFRYASTERLESERFWETLAFSYNGHVTHWIPLPKLPEE